MLSHMRESYQSQRKARWSSAVPSRSYHRPWAMITLSGCQVSILSKEERASFLWPKKVSLASIGVLPSGSATPKRRTSFP
jgi:hypothetical protein